MPGAQCNFRSGDNWLTRHALPAGRPGNYWRRDAPPPSTPIRSSSSSSSSGSIATPVADVNGYPHACCGGSCLIWFRLLRVCVDGWLFSFVTNPLPLNATRDKLVITRLCHVYINLINSTCLHKLCVYKDNSARNQVCFPGASAKIYTRFMDNMRGILKDYKQNNYIQFTNLR